MPSPAWTGDDGETGEAKGMTLGEAPLWEHASRHAQAEPRGINILQPDEPHYAKAVYTMTVCHLVQRLLWKTLH